MSLAESVVVFGIKYIREDVVERQLAERNRQLAEAQRDAERYQYFRNRVRGDRYPSGVARFTLPDITAHEGIFRGSVAEHLDNAIDAAIQEQKK